MNTSCHEVPDAADIKQNKITELEGERIRASLVRWLKKNKIVSIMLDTPEHVVAIDIVKLPPRTKSVLTLWGSIRIKDERK